MAGRNGTEMLRLGVFMMVSGWDILSPSCVAPHVDLTVSAIILGKLSIATSNI